MINRNEDIREAHAALDKAGVPYGATVPVRACQAAQMIIDLKATIKRLEATIELAGDLVYHNERRR